MERLNVEPRSPISDYGAITAGFPAAHSWQGMSGADLVGEDHGLHTITQTEFQFSTVRRHGRAHRSTRRPAALTSLTNDAGAVRSMTEAPESLEVRTRARSATQRCRPRQARRTRRAASGYSATT